MDREKSHLYAQRYIQQLPCADEIVILDRSRYNWAGVECVMGFCTKANQGYLMDFSRIFANSLRSTLRLATLYSKVNENGPPLLDLKLAIVRAIVELENPNLCPDTVASVARILEKRMDTAQKRFYVA